MCCVFLFWRVQLKEDRLAEQRRRQEIDVDAEMDVGRQKKVKAAPTMVGRSNPGFNAFQGTQNDINSGQHRWSNNFYNVGNRKQKPQHNGNGNGHNNKRPGNGHYQSHSNSKLNKFRHPSQQQHNNGPRPRPQQPRD